MSKIVSYESIAKAKGKLRLYINDPAILKVVLSPEGYSIPIELEGEVIVAKTADGKKHWFFTHNNPPFIPVFFDLDSELEEEK